MFRNSYNLQKPQSDANYLVLPDNQARVDNCFPDTILLFQIVYQADIMVDVVGNQSLTMYVGWCAVPINLVYTNKGDCRISLQIMGGVGHSFDR